MMYFGTDGIRGVANVDLTAQLAFNCGNALTKLKKSCRVVLGRDTRVSGDMLLHALAAGIMQGGGDVLDVGIMPTAGIAYLTPRYGADYGVVVSASHNPAEYNGIKIFDCDGYKLGDARERAVEEAMSGQIAALPTNTGRFTFMPRAEEDYVAHLVSHFNGLGGLRILLDCSNGAARAVAKAAFMQAGATTVAVNTSDAGLDVNDGCGALYAARLKEKVVGGGFDAGFAFDGDSDRLIALDHEGNVVDGDHVLYVLACDLARKGKLQPQCAVGTHHTNMGVEFALREKGIALKRADIGDKYVLEEMKKAGAKVGAEQSGHLILSDCTTTGDGILSAMALAKVMAETGMPLKKLDDAKGFAQANADLEITDKFRIINNETLQEELTHIRAELGNAGRILVRASGTEPKIRVMAECADADLAQSVAKRIVRFIEKISC